MFKSNARTMETLWSKMNILRTMSSIGQGVNYIKDNVRKGASDQLGLGIFNYS